MMACLAACIAACGREAAPAALTPAEQYREASLTAAAVAGKLTASSIAACGTAAAPATVGGAVMINARQCLSCRDLGYMLRRLREHAPSGTVVVVPAGDTTAICPYLRQERVHLPVLAVADRNRALAETPTLTFYTAKPDQTVDSVYFGANGTELLKRLEARTPPVPPPSGT